MIERVPGLSLTIQQLEYLAAVDRNTTWSGAAAELGVTTSALSQGIAELERRVGLRLFERDGRRRVPSADHAEVLAYATSVLAATDDLARWVDDRRSGRSGPLRVGMIDAAATHHFRDELRRFRRTAPGVELHLRVAPSGELLDALARAELDLAVCVSPPAPVPGVHCTEVREDPMDVLAPPDSFGDRPSAWGPWVTFPAGSHTRRVIADRIAAAGADFEVVAESHQPEVLREMVLLGVGWTVLPRTGPGLPDPGAAGPRAVRTVRAGFASRTLVVARRAAGAPHAAADALVAAITG